MLKKASFTIEAACIIPLMLIFIAGLLGFTYFTHHHNWCTASAYESIYYALQRNPEETDRAGAAEERLEERLHEIPLEISKISSEVTKGPARLSAGTRTVILPELFGDLFTMEADASAARIDAPAVKRAEWIVKYIKNMVHHS